MLVFGIRLDPLSGLTQHQWGVRTVSPRHMTSKVGTLNHSTTSLRMTWLLYGKQNKHDKVAQQYYSANSDDLAGDWLL